MIEIKKDSWHWKLYCSCNGRYNYLEMYLYRYVWEIISCIFVTAFLLLLLTILQLITLLPALIARWYPNFFAPFRKDDAIWIRHHNLLKLTKVKFPE